MEFKYILENPEFNEKEKRESIQKKITESEMLDEDGYPTEDALFCVENWNYEDPKGWFTFIKNIWYLSDWGWKESLEFHNWRKDTEVIHYSISTAGWSGNELIIKSMEKNDLLWHTTWYSSRRGGHYVFEILKE